MKWQVVGEKLAADLINDEAITFEAKSFTDLIENKMNKIGSINGKKEKSLEANLVTKGIAGHSCSPE
jgi:hypothetical protein